MEVDGSPRDESTLPKDPSDVVYSTMRNILSLQYIFLLNVLLSFSHFACPIANWAWLSASCILLVRRDD